MTKLLGLVLILILPIKLFAQAPNFTGKVINKETNVAVVGVNVSVYNERDIIFHTVSDSTGTFSIPSTLAGKINHIKISAFNFDELLINYIPKSITDKNSFIGTFKITSHVIELNEVKIKANKRYRDTTKIDLSGQKFERDIMIDDLFSKYGFSKDSNGTLYYNGKAVSDLVVNGKKFFSNSTNDIYNLLPALALNGIEVTETNIDSITNTTTLHPLLKVNLKLKEQYNKGKFGNGSLAFGTSKRHLAAANVYSYKNDEQLTINVNTNNINIGNSPPLEPVINFSATGNDVHTHNLMINYHNVLFKKVEFNLLAKGKQEGKNYRSESVREDEALNQFSTITNSSDTRSHGLSDINLSLVYQIDSLNSLSFTHTGNYYKTSLNDSLNYLIRSENLSSISSVTKNRINLNNSANTEAVYKHSSSAKKGRQIDITLTRKSVSDNNAETDQVYSINDKTIKSYFITGNQNLSERTYNFRTNIIEPLQNYSSYVNLFASYSHSFIRYRPNAISDSLNIDVQTAELTNQYMQSGVKYQRTLNKVSFDASLKGVLNLRKTLTADQKKQPYLFKLKRLFKNRL
jgi:hypothetical protein